jgi:crotonobetainyl-CoA:carnitine CoA-transferase CaiB-like acyl-CoA transferase
MAEEESLLQSIGWIYILLPVFYLILKRYLDQRIIKKKPSSDEDWLAGIALQRKCSEFDVFQCAGAQWRIAATQIAKDFKHFLNTAEMPHYVRDYVRKHRPDRNPAVRDVMDSGGNLPSSWSA